MARFVNASLLALIDPLMDRAYGARKRALFADHPNLIVEIGPGAGANFRYYRPGTKVIAIEPNESQHQRLRRRASSSGLEIELSGAKAESLPLADSSSSLVVSTLVLCSVDETGRVLAEVMRVLAPGGRFVFIEHVAAPEGSSLRRWQTRLRPAWARLFDHCQLDRPTGSVIREAGFSELKFESFRLSPRWLPVSPHIAGVAVRQSS